jgi:hypothetical protein
MPKVIIITTNIAELAGKPNGTYFPELTHAVEALKANGIEFDSKSRPDDDECIHRFHTLYLTHT